jgi:hypothetical protein
VNILNGSIGGPPPVTERSRLNDFPGVIGDDIAYGIGAAANKEEKKISTPSAASSEKPEAV